MSDYRSCGNCGYELCNNMFFVMACTEHDHGLWEPIPCPKCGGILSEIREHNGKQFRHCYACHMEVDV